MNTNITLNELQAKKNEFEKSHELRMAELDRMMHDFKHAENLTFDEIAEKRKNIDAALVEEQQRCEEFYNEYQKALMKAF